MNFCIYEVLIKGSEKEFSSTGVYLAVYNSADGVSVKDKEKY